MNHGAHSGSRADSLARHLQDATGVEVARCYQCGKCSAGCPVADEMDVPPSQVMRLLQVGQPRTDAEVLGSEGIWLCLSCETCGTRCPQEVDIPRVMDHVRQEALRRGRLHPGSRDILAFHRAFLDTLRATGRLYEIGLVAGYKARSRHLLKDVLLAPRMFVRGKLSLLPHRSGDLAGLRGVFRRTVKKEG